MNCRRVCGLLSAYLDSELALNEMDAVGIHINECPYCRGEYQSLLDTKRLLASLANRTSRAEIESLLRSEEDRRFTESGSSSFFRGVLRPKPLAATALLSLAGLWIASASLDSPADGVAPGSGGISFPMSAAAMPRFGTGVRSLRYLNDMVHNGSPTPVMIPVNTDGLVMSPESPYPVYVSGDGSRYRHSISLDNVFSTAAENRTTSASVSIPVYTVSEGNVMVYGQTSANSGTYSISMHHRDHTAPDRIR